MVAEHIKENIHESQGQRLPLQEFRKGNVSICSAHQPMPRAAVPSSKRGLWTALQLCNSLQLRKSHSRRYLKSQVFTITATATATAIVTTTTTTTTFTFTLYLCIWLLHFLFSKSEMQPGFIALPLSGNVLFQTSAKKFIAVYISIIQRGFGLCFSLLVRITMAMFSEDLNFFHSVSLLFISLKGLIIHSCFTSIL